MPQIVIQDQLVSFVEQVVGDKKTFTSHKQSVDEDTCPLVFFLHGWGSQKEVWQGLWQELDRQLANLQQTAKLVALDFPPFGASDKLKRVYNLDAYVDLTYKFIDKILKKNSLTKAPKTWSKIHLVGHSFGSRVAIRLLARQADSMAFLKEEEQIDYFRGESTEITDFQAEKKRKNLPKLDTQNQQIPANILDTNTSNFSLEKVSNSQNTSHLSWLCQSLVLLGAAGFRDDSWSIKLKEKAAKLVSPLFQLTFLGKLRAQIYHQLGSDYANLQGELKETFIQIIKEDLSADLPKILPKTLLIYGEQDQTTPPSFGHRMHKLLPHSQLHLLPNLGHYSFVQEPQQIAHLLVTFWQDKF